MEEKKIEKIINLVRGKEPNLFSEPDIAKGRIRVIINDYLEEEILTEGVLALMKRRRCSGNSMIK